MRQPYRATADEIAKYQSPDSPVETMLSAILAEHFGGGKAVRKSWDASLPVFARLLVNAGLGDIDMLIEYPMPNTALAAADVVLAGIDPRDGAQIYFVVELKQWSSTRTGWDSERFAQVPGLPVQNHPIDQVRGYCAFMANYVAELHSHPHAIHGVAYLHNATRASVRNLFDRQPDQYGRLFTGSDDADLIAYIRERITPAPAVVEELLDSEICRRQGFFDTAQEVLRGRSEIALLDNQRLAAAAVLNEVEQAAARDLTKKRLVVVTGGPGSGKSAIAIDIMNALRETTHTVVHATGSSAFTSTLRKHSDKRGSEVNALFTYFMQIYKNHGAGGGVDVLICDEAHRVRRISDGPRVKRSGLSQIDELVSCARVPVFFLDEQQAVRPDEVGTVEMIREYADQKGILVRHIQLEDQFRCGASADYIDWVRSLLGLRSGSYPAPWRGDDFTVRIASTPHEMERFLKARVDAGETARMTAGFCWEWSPPSADRTLPNDVVIDDWTRPWNKKGDAAVPSAAHSDLWATDPRGFGQIGCTYTAQGFEFDWAGVILGPDIGLGDDRLVVDPAKNCDKPLKGTKNKPVFDQDADRLIRNAYYVLLTRGLRGVVIYAVDPALRDLLHELVNDGYRRRRSTDAVAL
ncbi:DNA/RNA helicase domain-containing protein [Nocardia rhizosphaerihabitans]|uniref:DNA/RNA helicase domain-containing protein n=1 Tax=Nocardia rhizosphaerihabitans TaxID=1691570 RepID=UPI00366DF7FF